MKFNSFCSVVFVLILFGPIVIWSTSDDFLEIRTERSIGDKLQSFLGIFRSKTCPSGNDLLRYDEKKGQCYEVGSKGPCGNHMIFYAVPDNDRIGVCDCAYAHESRTLIYHAHTNQCYFVFEQGYCRPGQWLTFHSKTKLPFCETNPCVSKVAGNLLATFVLYEGTCVPLNSACSSSSGMKGVVKFVKGYVRPRCSGTHASQAVGAPVQGCAPGSYKAYTGRCVPLFQW